MAEDDDGNDDNAEDDDQDEGEERGGCADRQAWRLPCDVCLRMYAILVRSEVVP